MSNEVEQEKAKYVVLNYVYYTMQEYKLAIIGIGLLLPILNLFVYLFSYNIGLHMTYFVLSYWNLMILYRLCEEYNVRKYPIIGLKIIEDLKNGMYNCIALDYNNKEHSILMYSDGNSGFGDLKLSSLQKTRFRNMVKQAEQYPSMIGKRAFF